MNVDHHDLHHEFPEHAEAIHALKMGNQHFGRLFGEYNALTAKIEDLENNGSPVADLELEEMKKLRLKLKDELYAMLQAHRA
ncbi:MAG: YdcH family protein [Sulfuritalea sp.]|nr:YdcH family protein [Sulfuritalea sp.]